MGYNYTKTFTLAPNSTQGFSFPPEFTPEFGHAYQLGVCVNFRITSGGTYKGLIGVALNYNGNAASVQARETTAIDSADGYVQYATSVTLTFADLDPTATASFIIENRTTSSLDMNIQVTNMVSIDLGAKFTVTPLAVAE